MDAVQETKKSKVVIPTVEESETVVKLTEDEPMYLKYIGGSGLTLEVALTDGRRILEGHTPIKINDYRDFVRLTSNDNLFIECDSKGEPKGK